MKPAYPTGDRLGANQALFLETMGSRQVTSPTSFLVISRCEATLMTHARPIPGTTISVRFTDPIRTDWIPATIVGGELAGDGPYRMNLNFHQALSDELLALIILSCQSTDYSEPATRRQEMLKVDDYEATQHVVDACFRHMRMAQLFAL